MSFVHGIRQARLLFGKIKRVYITQSVTLRVNIRHQEIYATTQKHQCGEEIFHKLCTVRQTLHSKKTNTQLAFFKEQ